MILLWNSDLIRIYNTTDMSHGKVWEVNTISILRSSYGDNCMVGTIDAREIAIPSDGILVSNNEPSKECMTISRLLSNKETKEELSSGKKIDETKGFESLARLGIELERQNVQFGERVTVCGVEPEKFESFKTPTVSKSK